MGCLHWYSFSRIKDNMLAMLEGHLCSRRQCVGVKIRMRVHALMADIVSLEGPIPILTIRKRKEIQWKY